MWSLLSHCSVMLSLVIYPLSHGSVMFLMTILLGNHHHIEKRVVCPQEQQTANNQSHIVTGLAI